MDLAKGLLAKGYRLKEIARQAGSRTSSILQDLQAVEGIVAAGRTG